MATNPIYQPILLDEDQYYTTGMYPGQIVNQNQQPAQLPQDPPNPVDLDRNNAMARIDQWSEITNDESEFSMLWSEANSFEPSIFSNNVKKIKSWNNVAWTIAFWINFLITLILTIVLAVLYKNSDYDPLDKYRTPVALKSFGIAFPVAIFVNVIHLLYALFFPLIYIRLGIVIGVGYSIFFVAIPALVHGAYVCVLFPLLTIVGSIFWCILGQKNAKFTSVIFQHSIKLILRYHNILFFFLFMTILDSIINLGFAFMTYLIQANNWSNWFYFYVVISFFWISMTFSYVSFMTASGLAASWYFLADSQYFPDSPILDSAKRAFTSSFGAAALSGFIMAIINFLQILVRAPPNTGNQLANAIIQILKVIAQCILGILQGCFKMINQYSLCYVSIYGIPYGEAVRRWFEIRTKKLINVMINGITIERTLQYNMMVFVLGGSCLGLGFSYWAFEKGSPGRIFLPVFATMLSYGIFEVIRQPIVAISDTLIICFAESPQMLKTTAYELYEAFIEKYGYGLFHQKMDEGKI